MHVYLYILFAHTYKPGSILTNLMPKHIVLNAIHSPPPKKKKKKHTHKQKRMECRTLVGPHKVPHN